MVDLEFVVSNHISRRPVRVIVRGRGYENIIKKEEVMQPITEEKLLEWRMIGLTKQQMKIVIDFLRS